MGRRIAIAALICVAVAASPLRAAVACDRVVSYFLYPYQGSPLKQSEWRVFDPTTRTDHLFLRGANPDGVRWDTTFTTAFFTMRDSLYQVEWKLGARPRLIGALPRLSDFGEWWFNPDSSCWQVSAMSAVGEQDTASRWWCRVWQSNRSVTDWHLVRSDSVPCRDGDCGEWPWSEEPWTRRAPAVTLGDAAEEASVGAWMDEMLPFDTASVAVVGPAGDFSDHGNGDEYDWFLLPSETAPRRGIAFQFMASDEDVVSPPFFFVDLDRKTKQRLNGPEDAGWSTQLLSRHCGLTMTSGSRGAPTLIDSSTGKIVFSQGWNSEEAVWVPPPRP